MNAAVRRQNRALAAKRDRIATVVAVQMESETPHLDGLCPDCCDESESPSLVERVTGWVQRRAAGV
jgi:hypothetical protein